MADDENVKRNLMADGENAKKKENCMADGENVKRNLWLIWKCKKIWMITKM